MHNLMTEYQSESETMNEGSFELSPEFEFSQEYNQEVAGESSYELLPEFGSFETASYESSYETELANELMEVSNEAEFFDWLKSTAKKAAGVASNFLDSPTGQRATSALTDIAQKTLPSAGAKAGGFVGQKGGEALGGAIGGYFGVGPAGKAVGGWLGQKAGSYGGEKAGQWAADKFPSFVRFASDTIRNLANEVAVKGPNVSVQPSIIKAAQKHYPIILQVKGTISARPVQGNFPIQNEFQSEFQSEANYEGTFNEVTEMELATELLSISNESELDQFLGKLFKKAVGGIKKLAGGPLGGMLKGIAKKVLPIAGGALGSMIPIPGVGTALGSMAGKAASNLFELELEGLSAEDREFEIARAYVRFAGNAARRAANMRSGHPTKNARNAVINAARKYAPGLIVKRRSGSRTISDYSYTPDNNGYDSNQPEGGNWYRQGNRIIIEGI